MFGNQNVDTPRLDVPVSAGAGKAKRITEATNYQSGRWTGAGGTGPPMAPRPATPIAADMEGS